jgi:hypothetical protein
VTSAIGRGQAFFGCRPWCKRFSDRLCV